MKKYIDAEKLKAEIDYRLHCNGAFDEVGDYQWHYDQGIVDAYKHIREVITSLESLEQEQPEVDLEKEYQEFCKDYPFPWSSQYVNREYIDELCLSVARHFYELGLKAKEENK